MRLTAKEIRLAELVGTNWILLQLKSLIENNPKNDFVWSCVVFSNCFIHFSLWGKEHWSPVMQRWTRAGGQLTLGYYQHPHGAKIPPSEIDLTPPNCFVLGQNFHDGTVQVGLPKYFLLAQFFTQTPQGTWGQKVTALQFWALSGHVLPHYKSSKVVHFKATQTKIGQLRRPT